MSKGYAPDFIGDGIKLSLPTFDRTLGQSVLRSDDLRESLYSDHINFTVVMNEDTDQLIYSACNIDQSKFKETDPKKSKRPWRNDALVGSANQLKNEFYKDRTDSSGTKTLNPYDKGHMVNRKNAIWGDTKEEAMKAARATFVYSNSSLQHENLNRDEWKELELKLVRTFSHDKNDRLSVFTGPIFGFIDREVNLSAKKSARVPSGFFKVICYRTKNDDPKEKLGVMAFAIFQDDEILKDKRGNNTIKLYREYQVTISELQEWTGIQFGEQLYDRNPLFFHDVKERNSAHNVSACPERIPCNNTENVVPAASEKRIAVEELGARKVVINSAMIDPKGNEKTGEWISLHNRTGRKIRIDGWVLADGKMRKAALKGAIESGESIKIKKPKRVVYNLATLAEV